MIGREGMTGLAVVLGTDRSINDTFIQGAGSGWKITAENLRQADGAESVIAGGMVALCPRLRGADHVNGGCQRSQ
jgi:hypothetical protein